MASAARATSNRSPAARWLALGVLVCSHVACSGAARPPSAPAAPVPASAASGVSLSSYRAPLGCPDAAAYVRSVESRSQTLQLRSGAGSDAADRLRVRIQPDNVSAGWIGLLQIEGAHPLEREVRGERCEDVALALALIAVLRLDARAGAGEPQPSASGGSSAGVSAVPSASPVAPAAPAGPPAPAANSASEGRTARAAQAEPSAPSAAGTAPGELGAEGEALLPDRAVQIVRAAAPRRSPYEAELRDEAEPPRRAASTSWHPSLAVHLGYVSAPSQALHARLRGELQLGPRLQSGSVALGFGYARSSDRNASADLELGVISAQLDVCPLALSGAVWLRACAALSGGALAFSAKARDDDLVSQSSSRGWAALGPSLELGLPLDSRWSLRLLGEASFLLVRDRFEVERIVGDEAGQPSQITRTRLYRPPVGSFAALLGMGYAF